MLQYFSKKHFFLPLKTWKNRSQKLLIIDPNIFFRYYQPAPNQPKSQIFFHRNLPPSNFSILTLDTGVVSCPNRKKNHEWYLSSGASPPSPDSITTSKIPYLTKASLAQIPGSIQRRKLHSNDHNKIMSLARYLFNFGFNSVMKNMTSKKFIPLKDFLLIYLHVL